VGGRPVLTIRIKQKKKSLFTSHCINFNVIPMTMKNVFVIYSVLIIMLAVCITGCSSPQSVTIAQNNTPTITTLSQTIPTTTLGTHPKHIARRIIEPITKTIFSINEP
jgi:hypothetical protein